MNKKENNINDPIKNETNSPEIKSVITKQPSQNTQVIIIEEV